MSFKIILQPLAITGKRYLLKKVLGSGATAIVYRGFDMYEENGKFHAFKMLNLEEKQSNNELREIELLKQFDHPNVMKYHEDDKAKVFLPHNSEPKYGHYIKMDYCPHHQLLDYLNLNVFKENHAKIIMRSLIKGLQYVHDQGIVHRDLKRENILVNKEFNVLLADFGFSCKRDSGEKGLLKDYLGTRSYASPELWNQRPYYGVSNDVFSLGVVLFNLVTKKDPFEWASENDPKYRMLVKHNYDEFWMSLSSLNLSSQFQSLFTLMVAYDYEQRPSLDEIVKSDWMKSVYDSDLPELEKEVKQELKERYKLIQLAIKKKNESQEELIAQPIINRNIMNQKKTNIKYFNIEKMKKKR